MRAWILLLGSLLLPSVVDGINSCVDSNSADYRCHASDNEVHLDGCGLTDADIPDVEDCLDTVGRGNIISLFLEQNYLTTPTAELFQELGALVQLYLHENNLIALPLGLFDGLETLAALYLENNDLPTLLEGLFNDLGNLVGLHLESNQLVALPLGVFAGLGRLGNLHLDDNDLTTLPEGLFNDLGNLETLTLLRNDDLQCVPDTNADVDVHPSGPCECIPAPAVMCEVGLHCESGASGYTCGAAPMPTPAPSTAEPTPTPSASGTNSCVDPDSADYRCGTRPVLVQLGGCGLTDADIPHVDACLDTVGRDHILSLFLDYNFLTTPTADLFRGLEKLDELYLNDNNLIALPLGLFDGLETLAALHLDSNDLTTLPEGLFHDLEGLESLKLTGNDHLQCVPDTDADVDVEPLGPCDCTPPAAVMCDVGLDCASGASGYTCEIPMHKLGGEPHLSDVRSTDIV